MVKAQGPEGHVRQGVVTLLRGLKWRITEAAGKTPRGCVTGASDTHAQERPAISSLTLSLTLLVLSF